MQEIKHSKIETATHFFPKFARMQGNVFDSCMPSFFCMHRRGVGGTPDSLAWGVDGRAGVDQVAGVVGLGFL
jgi:hypothetical protein